MRGSLRRGGGGEQRRMLSTSPARAGREGRRRRQQLVQGHAQTVDITSFIDLSLESLRGQIAERPEQVSRGGQLVETFHPHEAEIHEPHDAVQVEQQIGGFDVTVQHALIVRVGQRVGRLPADHGHLAVVLSAQARTQRLTQARWAARSHALARHIDCGIYRRAAQQLVQGSALDELHRVVIETLRFAHVKDRDDVRVVQAGHGASLTAEAFHLPRIGQVVCRQHFECDTPTERFLDGLVDHSHPTPPCLAQNAIVGQLFRKLAVPARGQTRRG